jgi:hypothetical protein
MAGWRKGDQSPKKQSSDPYRDKVVDQGVSSKSKEVNSASPPTSGWRKTDKSSTNSANAPSQARWKKSERISAGKRSKSYRGLALVLCGLLLLGAGIIFWEKLFERERALDVVLSQKGTEKSQVLEASVLLQSQAKQWSNYSSKNWRTHQFEDFKSESSDYRYPVLFHVQAQVATAAVEIEIETILRECIEKIKPSGSAIVILDLVPDVRTLKLVDYEYPDRILGQYWNLGSEIENAWKKVTEDKATKDSKKELIVLTPSIAKGSEGEQNWLAPEVGGSVLQNFVMEALCSDEADEDRNRSITIGEFSKFIENKLADWMKTRRGSFVVTKLLTNNSALLKQKLLGLYETPEVEYQSPDALNEMKSNWDLIEPLWSKYENLLQRKAYRWAPERMVSIQQGLVALDHLAERTSLKQIEADRLLKTVEYALEACPDKSPATIETDLLKLPGRLANMDPAELDSLTVWQNGKPVFLGAGQQKRDESQTESPKGSEESKSKEASSVDKESADRKDEKSGVQPSEENSDSPSKYSAAELAVLTWESIKKFPPSATPEQLRDLIDEVLPKVENQTDTLQIHFLKLLRYDSYLFKPTSDIDSSLKSRISATIGRSVGVLQRWIDLVYADRRPDVVMKHSESLNRITVEVQNKIVDSWLAGLIPEDATLSDLEGKLTSAINDCETLEDALDFRDLYLLQRPYYVRWLITTFPYADGAQQKILRGMVDNLVEVDLALSDLQRIDEKKLLSAREKLVTSYQSFVADLLPDETSIPSERRFCSLRLIASNPVELGATNRIRIREKLLQFLESGKQLRIGKGESELAEATKQSGESGTQLRQFIADLRGKIPEESFQRGKSSTAENSIGTWQRIALLRKLKAPTFGDKYVQLSEAIGAGDEGDDSWKEQVLEQSEWLQKLALQRVLWGSGADVLSMSESPEKSYFVQLAAKCRAKLRDRDSGKELSEEDWLGQSAVKEAVTTNQRWKIDFKDGAEKKFNPDDFGGMSRKQEYEFNVEYPGKTDADRGDMAFGEPVAVPTWVSDSMPGEGFGSYRSQLKSATPFSLEIDPAKGFNGFVIGSFRGNRFPMAFSRLPESKEFTQLQLSRDRSDATVVIKGKNAPVLNVVFAVDYSGSMNAEAPAGESEGGNRLQEALRILEGTVEILENDYLRTGVVREIKIGAVTFGGKSVVKHDLVSLKDFRIVQLGENATGATPLYGAIESSIGLLERKEEDEGCLVVVITDGIDTSLDGIKGKSLDGLITTFQKTPHVQVLLLQAGSKEDFVKEMQDLQTGRSDKYNNQFRAEWDQSIAGIKSLVSKANGQFVWRPTASFNGKEMSEEIDKILPRTVVELSGPGKLSKEQFSLQENIVVPIESSGVGNASQSGERLWTITVRQSQLGESEGNEKVSKFGPFALWGGEKVSVDLELSRMELTRSDTKEKQKIAQDMRATSQWLEPKLLKEGSALTMNLDFGRDEKLAVERPELILVKLVNSKTAVEGVTEYRYERGFKYQRARFISLPESIFGKVDLAATRFDQTVWTVRKAESLEKYFIRPISVAAAEKGTWETVQLGEAWSNIAVPEVTVRRESIAGSEKHRVTLKLSGAEATKWYFCLIGNVWGEVNTKIGSDGSWVEKSYELSESESQKDQRAVLIREAQLDELSEANAEEKVVEKFEFLQIPVSDR